MENKRELEHSDTMLPVSDGLEGEEEYSMPELMVSTTLTHVYKMRAGDKMVCIKTPAKDSGLLLDLLKREYKIGVSLAHPFVVSYLRWEAESPVGPGIVMEYVDGTRLDEFLAGNKSRQVRRRIFEQLLDAAEYLHQSGIVHNDLKPANILVNRVNRSVKLIDFGFSDNDANALRRSLGGTVGYASPELSQGSTDADVRSDIYSLGMLMRDIFGHRYRHVSLRCLKPDPQRRYRSVAELRKAWRRARSVPRAAAVMLLAAALAASIGWNISIASRSAGASAEAASRIALLNDSIRKLNGEIAGLGVTMTKLNGEIADLGGYVDSIHAREQHRAALIALYNRGADSLADAVEARMRRCSDTVDLLRQLGDFRERFMQYDKNFIRKHPGEGAEIVDQLSAGIMNRTFERVKASYEIIYARVSKSG